MATLGVLRSVSTRCPRVLLPTLPRHGGHRGNGVSNSQLQPHHLHRQRRELHAALLTQGIGDALAAMPGAGKDNKGHITVPVPDPKLARLAELERTKAIPATVEVVELEQGLKDELTRAVEGASGQDVEPVEFSGKLLSSLRASDAIVLAVPCSEDAGDPVQWLKAAELALVSADLQTLEQQVCKDGNGGPDAELDLTKLRKSLSSAKDPAVRRDAENLVQDILAPGFTALRKRLRAGVAARGARAGLCEPGDTGVATFGAIDARIEDLARGWLNALVTWKPLCVLADVPESDARIGESGSESEGGILGNSSSQRLSAHAKAHGMPCITTCSALEGEVVGLRDEPEFLADYLASFGLREGEAAADSLHPWCSQSSDLARCIPRLFNLLTYYTAGEKEARAWMCTRVRKDGSPLAFDLFDSAKATVAAGKSGKVGKGSSASEEDGVPAPLAARAIHTSFENRVKNVEIWKYEDLDSLGATDSGPSAKDRAKSAGKVKKLPAQTLLQEGDVVEFGLG